MATRHCSQDTLIPRLGNSTISIYRSRLPICCIGGMRAVLCSGSLPAAEASGDLLSPTKKSIDNSFDTRMRILDLWGFASCHIKHKYLSEAWRRLYNADRSPRTGFRHSLELSRHRHTLILPFDLLQHTCRHPEYMISQARH